MFCINVKSSFGRINAYIPPGYAPVNGIGLPSILGTSLPRKQDRP